MKIDAWVIALDTTHEYSIAEKDAPFIKRIEGVYLFDRNRTINACELTSYGLKYLYTLITFADSTSDSLRNVLEDDYVHGGVFQGDSDIYVHVSTIDKILAEGNSNVVEQYGDSGVSLDNCDYDDQLDAICDHFICNRPF